MPTRALCSSVFVHVLFPSFVSFGLFSSVPGPRSNLRSIDIHRLRLRIGIGLLLFASSSTIGRVLLFLALPPHPLLCGVFSVHYVWVRLLNLPAFTRILVPREWLVRLRTGFF